MPVSRGFLAQCEQEALQFSGAIQSFGALLVVSADGRITHKSANFDEFTDLAAMEIGSSLEGVLAEVMAALQEPPGTRLYLEQALSRGAVMLDVVANRSDSGEVIFELLAACSAPVIDSCPFVTAIETEAHLEQMRQQLIDWIAEVTGFNRVMYYQFLDDDDGKVVAEYCREEAQGSYLGLRFPASDIPAIARRIYLLNPWRSIEDAAATSVQVFGEGKLDLSRTDLRSVSPVHSVYMQNMGDRASFSLPVTLGQELDALISCHHHDPAHLPLPVKRVIYEQVRQFNTFLRDFKTRQRMRQLDEARYDIRCQLSLLEQQRVDQRWQILSQWLQEWAQVDGVLWLQEHRCLTAGVQLPQDAVDWLDNWLLNQSKDLVFMTDKLREWSGQDWLTEVAGIAAVRMRVGRESVRLFLLRTEQTMSIDWGGNPDKPVEYHDGELGIAPRRSFARWIEKRIGFSAPWDKQVNLQLLRFREEYQSRCAFLPLFGEDHAK